MEDTINNLLKASLESLSKQHNLELDIDCLDTCIEQPKDKKNGDFASTIALRFAKKLKSNPRTIAKDIIEGLPKNSIIDKVEIAGPGFINFYINDNAFINVVKKIREQNLNYCNDLAKNLKLKNWDKKINIEYISSNPTGPMHVGHGRWAALGDSISRILGHLGFSVYDEFYVNDHGVQMQLFAKSLYTRYLQICGMDVELDDDSYGGEYVVDLAREIYKQDKDKWVPSNLKDTSKDEVINYFKSVGYKSMMNKIKKTLDEFGNDFKTFFSESSLYIKDKNGLSKIDYALDYLNNNNLIYKKDDATWFATSKLGDDKDRVLIKSDGSYTYFMSDIAYHFDKYNRGFDHLIDIWGADHHGYISRCKAFVKAFKKEESSFEVILGQLVNLYRDGVEVRMSKRSGNMITFEELIDEVGVDATRFLMLSKSSTQPIDFDIELAKKQDSTNPVYYVQYAHARICSILRRAYIDLGANATSNFGFGSGAFEATGADEAKLSILPMTDVANKVASIDTNLEYLTKDSEVELARVLNNFKNSLISAAETRSPHKLVNYSKKLASQFHKFYTECRVMEKDRNLRKARLSLCDATRIILELTLYLLGVSAPVKM